MNNQSLAQKQRNADGNQIVLSAKNQDKEDWDGKHQNQLQQENITPAKILADVIANISVADVMATYYSTMWWQMLLPGGRWKSHCRVGGY